MTSPTPTRNTRAKSRLATVGSAAAPATPARQPARKKNASMLDVIEEEETALRVPKERPRPRPKKKMAVDSDADKVNISPAKRARQQKAVDKQRRAAGESAYFILRRIQLLQR